MVQSIRFKPPTLLAAAAILIAALACDLTPPASPTSTAPAPTVTLEPPPPDPPTATPGAPANPEQAAVGTATTDAAGQAVFKDPLLGGDLTLTAVDADTSAPIPGLQTWFMSLGTEVLILIRDPTRNYAPTIDEIPYEGLGPAPTVEITLFPYAAITQSQEDWFSYFLIYPDLDPWTVAAEVTCAGPPAIQPGMGGGEGAGPLMANLTAAAALTFASFDTLPAPQGVAEDLQAMPDSPPVAEQYRTQTPALIQWETLTLHPELPALARPTGYCLEPLDSTDPQAILDWVQYGLEQNNQAVFETLTAADGVGYVNYLEGGQSNSLETFLADLALRLPDGARCDGFAFSDPWFQIWTSGWEPDWEITELCYDSCQPVDPPHTSDIAGFFFRPGEDERWELQTLWLNDPSLWEEAYGAEILGCEVPVEGR